MKERKLLESNDTFGSMQMQLARLAPVDSEIGYTHVTAPLSVLQSAEYSAIHIFRIDWRTKRQKRQGKPALYANFLALERRGKEEALVVYFPHTAETTYDSIQYLVPTKSLINESNGPPSPSNQMLDQSQKDIMRAEKHGELSPEQKNKQARARVLVDILTNASKEDFLQIVDMSEIEAHKLAKDFEALVDPLVDTILARASREEAEASPLLKVFRFGEVTQTVAFFFGINGQRLIFSHTLGPNNRQSFQAILVDAQEGSVPLDKDTNVEYTLYSWTRGYAYPSMKGKKGICTVGDLATQLTKREDSSRIDVPFDLQASGELTDALRLAVRNLNK